MEKRSKYMANESCREFTLKLGTLYNNKKRAI